MITEILIALIAFLGTIAGSGLGVIASNKLVTFRLDKLEKKVELHNSVIERMTVAELKIKGLEGER